MNELPPKPETARKLGLFYHETLPGTLLLQWCLTPFLSTQGVQRENQRAAAGDASCGLWPSFVMSLPQVCSSHSAFVTWWEGVRFCGSFSFISSCPFPRLFGFLCFLWCLLVLVGGLKIYRVLKWSWAVWIKVECLRESTVWQELKSGMLSYSWELLPAVCR